MRRKIKPDDDLGHHVQEILAASERAAKLTRSMLAFSRKQAMELRTVDLNGVMSGIQKMLSRLIGEDIEFTVHGSGGALLVEADAGQLEHALINLITNARDAMPRGGKLTVTMERLTIPVEEDRISPGIYAVMRVIDTGSGMDRETREHIFEPFFTKKEIGKGTGLGLAMAYGIVQKHNGFIRVSSEPGEGSTFTIYLPVSVRDLPGAEKEVEELVPLGTETIFVVEDNPNVRMVTRDMLEECGYTVLEAVDGGDALKVFQDKQDGIGLLLCDLIMPRKSGKDTYDEIKKMKPGLKAIFTSGYTRDILAEKGLLEDDTNFLSKPVSMIDLARTVRKVLDA